VFDVAVAAARRMSIREKAFSLALPETRFWHLPQAATRPLFSLNNF